MALNIKNPATVALAEELARRQGVSKTAAIHQALSERLHRLGRGEAAEQRLLGELRAISERVGRLPELDKRSDEDIVGYGRIRDSGLMVIDTSAIVAILRNRAGSRGAEALRRAIVTDPIRLVPATCVLEARMVMVSRRGDM